MRPCVPGVELAVPLGPEEVADRAAGAVLHGDLTALRLHVETLTLAKDLSEFISREFSGMGRIGVPGSAILTVPPPPEELDLELLKFRILLRLLCIRWDNEFELLLD